jgi:hypothetical protein
MGRNPLKTPLFPTVTHYSEKKGGGQAVQGYFLFLGQRLMALNSSVVPFINTILETMTFRILCK